MKNAVCSIYDYPEVNDRPPSNSSLSTRVSDLQTNYISSNQERMQFGMNEDERITSSPAADLPNNEWNNKANWQILNVPAAESVHAEKAPETAEPTSILGQRLKRIVSSELEQYAPYAKYFLGCKRCGTLRPHCVCGECINKCPDLSKCTKDKRQLSHCPTCLHIGKGISPHKTFSYSIDVYICANCAQFYSFWSTNSQEIHNKLASLKCESRWAMKGNCFRYQRCNFIKLSKQNF